MQQVKKVSFIFIVTLGILSMLPPLGVDMYLPSFLNIAQDLHIEPEQVQKTLTWFSFGLTVGQLFWGPVGDSYGRKPIILLGVIVSAVTAFLLTNVDHIGSFTFYRFLQGFFGAAPVVLVGALLRDLFQKNQLSQVMSAMTLVVMVAPLVAPIIGGYLVKFFHWHSVFYVIAFMGFISAILVFFLIPETHQRENRIPLRLNLVIRNFITVWKHKEVLGYMLSSGLGFGGMFAFLTAGSIVYIGLYGVQVDHFGFFFMGNIAVMTIGSITNGRLVQRVGAERMMQIGLAIQLIAGIWLALVALFDLGFWAMAVGIMLFVGQISLISSNSMASILEHFPTMAGTANSLTGCVRFGLGSAVGALVASMKMESAAPMLLTMSGCVVLAVFFYYFLTYRT